MTIEEFKKLHFTETLYLRDNVIPYDWEQHEDRNGYKYESGIITVIQRRDPQPNSPVIASGQEYVAIFYCTNCGKNGSVSVHPKYLSTSPWPVSGTPVTDSKPIKKADRTVTQLLMEYIIKDENTIDSLYLKGKISYNESCILSAYLQYLEAIKSINNNQLKTTKEDGRNNIKKVRRPHCSIRGTEEIRPGSLKRNKS